MWGRCCVQCPWNFWELLVSWLTGSSILCCARSFLDLGVVLLYFGILNRLLHHLLPVHILKAHFWNHLICSLSPRLSNLWLLFLLLHVSFVGVDGVLWLITEIQYDRFFLLELSRVYRLPQYLTGLWLSCRLCIRPCIRRLVQKLVPSTELKTLSLLHKLLLQVTWLVLVLLMCRWLSFITLGLLSVGVFLISALIYLFIM